MRFLWFLFTFNKDGEFDGEFAKFPVFYFAV